MLKHVGFYFADCTDPQGPGLKARIIGKDHAHILSVVVVLFSMIRPQKQPATILIGT